MGEKMMRRPQKWQKISANDTSGKDLVSRIYIKNSYNSTTERQTTQLKMEKDLNIHHSKEDKQTAKVQEERFNIIINCEEM